MAEQNISNQRLSELSGLHRVTISKLKKSDDLKQISGDTLNRLCNALKCTPNDLIEFKPDELEVAG
jgi:putative transcriptional regulator